MNNLVFQGLEALHSFRQVQKQYQEYHQLFTLPVIRFEAFKEWQPPPSRWIKVNVDCLVGKSTSAVTAVSRDLHRNIVIVATSLIKTKDPLVDEREAIRFALQASFKSAFSIISIESDNALAISSVISSAIICPWSLQNIKMDYDTLSQVFEIT